MARTVYDEAGALVDWVDPFERKLRLRPEALGRHLRLVQDLNDDDLTRLRRGYFDRVGYGLK